MLCNTKCNTVSHAQLIVLSEQLEPVNSFTEASGITILAVVGLIVKLPTVVVAFYRAYAVLGFLVSGPAHDIVRSNVVYSNCVNRLSVARIAVFVVIPVISVYFRQPSAA